MDQVTIEEKKKKSPGRPKKVWTEDELAAKAAKEAAKKEAKKAERAAAKEARAAMTPEERKAARIAAKEAKAAKNSGSVALNEIREAYTRLGQLLEAMTLKV